MTAYHAFTTRCARAHSSFVSNMGSLLGALYYYAASP